MNITRAQVKDCPSTHLPVQSQSKKHWKKCEICPKLTINTPEWRQWGRSGVFIVNFERISHLFLDFLWLILKELTFK